MNVINNVPSIWKSDPWFAITVLILIFVSVAAAIAISASLVYYRKCKEYRISEEKVRSAKERLERIINTAPISYLLTIDGKVVELNEAMKRDTGLNIGEDAIIIQDSPEHRNRIFKQVFQEKTVTNEIMRIKLVNGEIHRCNTNFATVEYDHRTALAVWAVDVEENERRKDELITSQRETEEVEERLEWIIRNSSVGYLLVIGGRIVEINDNLKRATGLKEGDILQDSYGGINRLGDIIERFKQQEEINNEVVELDFANGEKHRCLVNIASFKYNGQPSSVAWVVDIESSEMQKDQLQAILDMLPMAVRIIENETKIITYANRAAADMFGVDNPKNAFGMHSLCFLPERQPDGIISEDLMKHSTLTGTPSAREVTLRNTNGELFSSLITSILIDYNGVESSLGIIEDLTAEKEYQKMLANTAEKEREANSIKSRFLANMSHEIRTPMNAIIGLTEIELHSDFLEEPKEIYKKINTSAKNLLSIVNDILDLSKIEADKFDLCEDEFELEEVLNSALMVTAPRLDGKNVELMLNGALDLPRYVVGDRTRLWQILKNFLDNATKFTDKGKITLTVFADHERFSDKAVTISFVIEDTGIGMEESQIESIFLPYQQIHNSAQRRYSGTGLGMPISRQLCELMGGTLKIESQMGKGTSIYFSIPFKRSENIETELESAKSTALIGIDVLAVDDDRLVLNIMERLLENCNANCTTAQSGTEAIDIIIEHSDRGETFDIILLDYMMEGMNGLETAKQIQLALPKGPKLLMVTAYQRLLVKDQLIESGIDGVIEKPFIPSHFIDRLCAVLGYENEDNLETSEVYTKFQDVNVLLCEDYRINQEVAVGMLAQFGISAAIAENGSKGIELLNSGRAFDLIFMDIQMPVMNGYEAARIIRDDPGFSTIPIIGLTADAMNEVVDQCLRVGMNDHLAKPIEYDSLYGMLLKWLPESKRVSSGEAVRPVVDPLNEALARFGGDEERYKNALLEFSQLLPDEWRDYNSMMEYEDETKRFIHKLKGAAGTLSEKEIHKCAAEFETSLYGGEPNKELYDQLIEICNTSKKRITEQMRGSDAVILAVGTDSELTRILIILKDALHEYDPEAIDPVIISLKGKKWPSADEQGLSQLYAFVRKFDYSAALDVLDKMIEINR